MVENPIPSNTSVKKTNSDDGILPDQIEDQSMKNSSSRGKKRGLPDVDIAQMLSDSKLRNCSKKDEDTILNKTSHREFKVKESDKVSPIGTRRKKDQGVSLEQLKQYNVMSLKMSERDAQIQEEKSHNFNIETIENLSRAKDVSFMKQNFMEFSFQANPQDGKNKM